MDRGTPNVLVDCWTRSRTLAADLVWIVGFSLLTGLLAQVKIPLPFTPVPITGQTFAVLLAGAALGSRRGFASQALYLAEGAAGLPVFAGGGSTLAHLLGPTGGYLWSYPLAAGLLGLAAERGAGRKVSRLLPALCLADALILTCGSSWLHNFLGGSYRQALLLGFYPFLFGDMLKVALVGISLPRVLDYCQLRRSGGDRPGADAGADD
jgi:biotin transport system substrate-specific component